MANQKPPNPNTAYGRKRQREEYYRTKAALSPEDRAKQNTNEFFFIVIFIGVLALVAYFIGGSGAVAHWFQH
ncbi:hypothetical protein [Mucilaginibacter sp. 3215]|uniref:hypothetical protein n=1 Tax=Mucilaginibacter sp. 3215 TaxID=3373912 RepID=UPI003D217595